MLQPVFALLALLVAALLGPSGCRDPNPTFFFDAAPGDAATDAGGDARDGGVESAADNPSDGGSQ